MLNYPLLILGIIIAVAAAVAKAAKYFELPYLKQILYVDVIASIIAIGVLVQLQHTNSRRLAKIDADVAETRSEASAAKKAAGSDILSEKAFRQLVEELRRLPKIPITVLFGQNESKGNVLGHQLAKALIEAGFQPRVENPNILIPEGPSGVGMLYPDKIPPQTPEGIFHALEKLGVEVAQPLSGKNNLPFLLIQVRDPSPNPNR